MLNILITGSSGLVGSALTKQLSNCNLFIPRSSELNLLNYNDINIYLKNNKIDIVIHLAANVGGLFKNMQQKVNMFEDNFLMNFNVLRACHENAVKKVVSCLSTCIFPDNIKYPISENDLHLGPPHHSNDAYAYAKRMLDIHSQIYREQYNDNFVTIIPTNIYGPNDNYNLQDAHVIPALIHRCYLAKKDGENFVVKGSGKPLRQFIYSEDLAYLIKIVLEKYDEKDPIILSVGEEDEVSIGDIAEMIAREYGMEDKLIFDNSSADGQFKKTASNKKLLHFLKENAIEIKWTPIKEGIHESVKWFIENYENARK